MNNKTNKKNNNKPLVSVLIPIYNGIPYLEEALNSIFSQTYSNFEIILADDGSSDNSKKICAEYDAKHTNVTYIDFPNNRGMDRALNAGIKVAKGKYIARLNQDDLMLPDRLKKQVDFLESHPEHVIVGAKMAVFKGAGEVYGFMEYPLHDDELRNKWLLVSPFGDPTVMYLRDAVLKTEGYDQRYWPADDLHMWYRISQHGKMANLPDVLTMFRQHPGAGSYKAYKKMVKKTMKVHIWASKNIQKPSFKVRLYWLTQYVAGMVLPPSINWYAYHIIKKIINKKSVDLDADYREVQSMYKKLAFEL